MLTVTAESAVQRICGPQADGWCAPPVSDDEAFLWSDVIFVLHHGGGILPRLRSNAALAH